ncbi:MAG: hypothetical protein EA348_11290 [Pseudomonadaceae bacterium]|nr:MAG: hypothetical protein EA348_11290 [Pseudomonadaceae bacterium]
MSSYPLGLSEEEWVRLSPEQQLDARSRQAEIDQAERARRAEAARLAAEQQRLEQQAREERLRNAAPGDLVQCVLDDAEGYFAGDWRTASPVGFSLVLGYREVIAVAEQDRSSRQVLAHASFDGAQIELCRPHRNECARLAATQNQLQRGVSRHVQLDRVLRGRLYCDMPRSSGYWPR